MMIVAMLLALVLPTTSFSLTRAPAPRSIVARRATPAAVVMFADEDEPLLNSTSALRLLDQQLRSMRSHSAFFDEILDEETDTLNLLAERSALFNDAHENDLKLKESDTGYTVSMHAPGVAAEDLDVTVEDGMLTVAGETRLEEAGAAFSSSFRRSISLPHDADADVMSTDYRDGSVSIEIPKTAALLDGV